MPKPKKPIKLPKTIWVVYEFDELTTLPGASVYTDPEQIGELFEDEVVAHYTLVPTKNRPTKEL